MTFIQVNTTIVEAFVGINFTPVPEHGIVEIVALLDENGLSIDSERVFSPTILCSTIRQVD